LGEALHKHTIVKLELNEEELATIRIALEEYSECQWDRYTWTNVQGDYEESELAKEIIARLDNITDEKPVEEELEDCIDPGVAWDRLNTAREVYRKSMTREVMRNIEDSRRQSNVRSSSNSATVNPFDMSGLEY
jgi:hypothetical protein